MRRLRILLLTMGVEELQHWRNQHARPLVARLFLVHPSRAGLTYWAHLLTALHLAYKLAVAAGACCIHAILPGFFQRTASTIITELHTAALDRPEETSARIILLRSTQR